MKKLIVLAVASLFATSAVAGEMKWNGSAGWRWISNKQSDGLQSKNNTTDNKDVSTVKSKAHNVRANLGVSGGWENVEWGVGVRTTSAANSDWKAVQNAGDHAAAFELAWFRYLKDFGALDINVTVGRQKNVFAYDETSQNFFDNDVRFDGFGWQFNYGMFGMNAAQYILGARTGAAGAGGASAYSSTEATENVANTRRHMNVLYGFQPHMKWKFSDEIETMFAVGYYKWVDDTNTNTTSGGYTSANAGTKPVIAPGAFRVHNPRQLQFLSSWTLPMNFSFVGEYVMNKKSMYNGASVATYTGAVNGVDVSRSALALTLKYGAIKKAQDWSLSYTYSSKGIASVINTYSNDTFLADNKGHIVNAAYSLADNFTIGGKAIFNQEKQLLHAATGKVYNTTNPNNSAQKTKMTYFELNTGVMF